jgi:Xaa-Pro aminopeptidase
MSIGRREFLSLVAAGAAVTQAAETPAAASTPGAAPRDLERLAAQPLVNRPRAAQVLRDENLAALVCARPSNIYYLSNYWPINARQGSLDTTYAVLPRNEQLPIALVLGEFSYYYTAADHPLPAGVKLYLYSSGRGLAPLEAAVKTDNRYAPASFFPVADHAAPGEREQTRRTRTLAVGHTFASRQEALRAALADLEIPLTADSASRVGIDDLQAQAAVAAVRQGFTTVAEDTLRRVRLVKTPAEIALLRIAATNNVEAALAAAKRACELGSIRAFRADFHAEAAARGNTGVFLVIDGVSSDAYDAPLKSGSAFMIDCVTQLRGYHGDFARTVFIGEPSAPMKRATEAMALGWDAVRAELKPGLKFSAISRIGRETIRKQGYPHAIPFAPHSVGLWHSDQPRAAADGSPVDIALEEGMILSVDCPLMESGHGGTGHLEDLMLITRNGAEPIHPTGDRIIVV